MAGDLTMKGIPIDERLFDDNGKDAPGNLALAVSVKEPRVGAACHEACRQIGLTRDMQVVSKRDWPARECDGFGAAIVVHAFKAEFE